jgi:hypothetical protein
MIFMQRFEKDKTIPDLVAACKDICCMLSKAVQNIITKYRSPLPYAIEIGHMK